MTTEREIEAAIRQKYGPEPTAEPYIGHGWGDEAVRHYERFLGHYGVITDPALWPRQAAYQKGQQVRYQAHTPKKRAGQVGTIVGFSREAPSARGFGLGYMSSAGGNKVVVAWPSGELSKVRPGDLEVAQ